MPGNNKILIIVDDIHYGELLNDALKDFGYNTVLTYSATGGLDIVRQQKLDMIVCDINMPSLKGLQLVEKLTNMYLDIPIIIITGLNDLKIVKKAMEMGVSDYLMKPVKMHELPLVVEKSFERKRQVSQKMQNDKADTLLKALKALMRALEAKDQYTCGHSHRVASLAMLMANKLGLSDDEKYALELASLLHDIGKIGMPDDILKKSEGLADAEFNIAKDHPVIGSQIIGEISELSEVASVVRHHHERYDGSGYPDGLKGEAIPFFARILAIIDCYEALVSDRVYRKSVGNVTALSVIKKNAGVQFDPDLVKVFAKIINDHVAIKDLDIDKPVKTKPRTEKQTEHIIG